LRSMNQG